MARLRSLLRIPKTQLRNLTRISRGYPLTTPSLGSTTLDKDDVEIAQKLLKDHTSWDNQSKVTEYETQFAQWNGSRYAFAFMGGRVALSACIYALDLQRGDEVIIPGYTCVVVPNAFTYEGIKPVYVDIELDTYGMDIQTIQKAITERTKAVMLHHLYGLVCRDYEAIINLAREFNLKVIEDCAHATGAEYKGRKVGNLGDVAFYSSEQSKIFNTIQGGICITNSNELAKRVGEFYRMAALPDEGWIENQLTTLILNYYCFKDPQRWWKCDVAEVLYGSARMESTTREEEQGIKPSYYGQRMPSPVAEVGMNQIKKIDQYNELRRVTAKRWDLWCEENSYKKPLVVDGSKPVYLRYPVIVEQEKKRDLSWVYMELGVTPGVWFVSNIHPINVHLAECRNANRAAACCINLPCLE